MTRLSAAPAKTGGTIANFGPAALLGAVGLVGLLALRLAPAPEDTVAALIYPPWVPAPVLTAELGAIDAPIRDFRWNGRLVALDLTQATPQARAELGQWRVGHALRLSGSFQPSCGKTRNR